MVSRKTSLLLASVFLLPIALQAQDRSAPKPKPRVIMVGVNGMELDIIRPLLLKGQMPNLYRVIEKGAYGKLRTVSGPNCPRVYSTLFTSTNPEEHGVTGFIVGGITANTHMLKEEPIWSMLSKSGITVGMANVPATFPVMPVNGYMISGMLTRGKNCEDGVLCAPKLSEVTGGDAVYPSSLREELLKNVGDFYIDCERMPSAADLKQHETAVIDHWLAKVQTIRDQQTKLFDYLLTTHPTNFTFLAQSCEDRTGHWLYPITPFNVGYNASINSVRQDALPDHEKTTPVIAKHDFADGDDVPGSLFVMGPGIKHDFRLMGLAASVYDIAPTLLHIYGIEQPKQMRGRALTEVFEGAENKVAASK